METEALLGRMRGYSTIETLTELLNVNRHTATNYVSFLRKAGLVMTKHAKDRTRVYYISPTNLLKGKTYFDIIAENSPIKMAEPEPHKIYGRNITLEETLIYTLSTGEVRLVLGSLGLFKKIKNWTLLARLAKEKNTKREICALYDLARSIMKVKRMSEKFRRSAMPKEDDPYIHIIEGSKSKDYKDIQERWKVYLPINRADLEDYLR